MTNKRAAPVSRSTAPPSPKPRRRRRGWLGLAIALAISLAVGFAYLRVGDSPIAIAIEGQTLTWRFLLRGPVAPPGDVAIIAVDDRTAAEAGRLPIPRRMLADAIDRLRAAGVTVIGVDLLMLEPEPPSNGTVASPGDRALFAALEAGPPPAVLAAAFLAQPGRPVDEAVHRALGAAAYRSVRQSSDALPGAIMAAGAVQPPIPLLLPVASLGHTNLPADEGITQRFLPLAVAYDGLYIPALPVEVARLALGLAPGDMTLSLGRSLQLGTRWLRTDRRTRLPLGYYGPAGTIETHSLADLLAGSIDPALLRGKAVLIGATALGVGDLFVTPFSSAMPGVEVMATAVDNLLHGTALDRSFRVVVLDLAAILCLGLLAFAAARLLPPALSGVVAASFLLGWAILAQLGFAAGLWLDLTFPSAAILLNAGTAAALRAAEERRLRRDADRQRRNLSRFQAPAMAGLLAEQDEAELAGHEQPAAVLFVDMAGFTRRSERMTPADTARLLRDFHRRIEAAVLAHGGVLLSFTGDGAMVIFGLPAPGPQDAAAALAAARRLVGDIAHWNEALADQGVPPLSIRIGIHCGPVMIAALGGEAQRQLTAAGDTVNVASRLESLSHGYRAPISISDAVHQAVRDAGRAELLQGFRRLPPQPLRGRAGTITVWIGGAAVIASRLVP